MKNPLLKIAFACITAMLFIGIADTQAYAKKNITVTPSKLIQKAKTHPSVYDSSVAHCMALNEYMESMRKAGGGTITFKKGVYRFQYSVCIPSNVEVIFQDGVVIENIYDTKAHIAPSTAMWQFVPKNKTYINNSVGKYNGTQNAKMTAEGKVVFKMHNIQGVCIIAAHCKNVEISGVTFTGMNGKHYIEVNGSKNITIKNCKFKKAKKKYLKKYFAKEAINIDLADTETKGLNLNWVKHDKTPCSNIKIIGNSFSGMSRAVGSHKYSQTSKGKNIYHKKIILKNNKFKNIYDNGIFILNWKNVTISGNYFYNIGNKSKLTYSSGSHAISGGGIENITIKKNKFEKIKRNPVNFSVQRNVGPGSKYRKIRVYITTDEALEMIDNKSVDCGNDMTDLFAGYDVIFFRGSGERMKAMAVGVSFKDKLVNYKL
jgi:hypothetical protein